MDHIWQEVAKYLWGLLVPIGIWAWNKQDGRLNKLEENTVTRAEAQERREVVDVQLEARRQDVIALHAKVEDKVERLNDKLDGVSRDMHTGFDSIKDILLRRVK